MQHSGTTMKTTARIAISGTTTLLVLQIANAMIANPASTNIIMTASASVKDIVSCDDLKFRNFHKKTLDAVMQSMKVVRAVQTVGLNSNHCVSWTCKVNKSCIARVPIQYSLHAHA